MSEGCRADRGGNSPRQSYPASAGRSRRALHGRAGLGCRLGGRRGGDGNRPADPVGSGQAGAAERGRCREADPGGRGYESRGRRAGDAAGSHGDRGGPAPPRGRARERPNASPAGDCRARGARGGRSPAAFRKCARSGARPSRISPHADRAASGGTGADGRRARLRPGRALLGGAPPAHARRGSRAARRTSRCGGSSRPRGRDAAHSFPRDARATAANAPGPRGTGTERCPRPSSRRERGAAAAAPAGGVPKGAQPGADSRSRNGSPPWSRSW